MNQVNDLDRELYRIGAVQFGHFETQPGAFAPARINLRLLSSYPGTLTALASVLAPLTRFDGITHLLAAPGTIILGTALSLQTGMPLVYPASDDPDHIEGAYDYNVPTVLLTDAPVDGMAERKLIASVRRHGLHVEAILAVYDLGGLARLADLRLMTAALRTGADLLALCSARPLRETVETWLRETQ